MCASVCGCIYQVTSVSHKVASVKRTSQSKMSQFGTFFVVTFASMTMPCAAKLTDLFPRNGQCGLSTKERLDTMRQIQDVADRLQTDGV